VFLGSDAIVIAWLRLAATAVALCGLFWLILRTIPLLRAIDILAATWRPLVSSAVMAASLAFLSAQTDLSPSLGLPLKVAVGAALYTLVLGVLWWLTGRPPGAESYMLEKLLQYSRLKWRLA
jgi:hypothetical protein